MSLARQALLLLAGTLALNGLHWALFGGGDKETADGDDVAHQDGLPRDISSPEDLFRWLDDLRVPPHLRPSCSALPECLLALSEASSSLDVLPGLSDSARRGLEEVTGRAERALALDSWLADNGWAALADPAREAGVRTLKQLKAFRPDGKSRQHLGPGDLEELFKAQEYLPDDEQGVENLERLVISKLHDRREGGGRSRPDSPPGLFSKLLTFLLTGAVFWLVWDLGLTPTEVIWGAPLHKSLTRLEWPEDMTASHTKTVKVSFYDVRGRPIAVAASVPLMTAEVWHQHRRVNAFVSAPGGGGSPPAESSGGSNTSSPNVMHLTFTSRAAGRYYVTLKCNGALVRGFPALALVEPGRPDPRETVLAGVRSSTLVLTAGVPETVQIDPRDSFGNSMPKSRLPGLAGRFGVRLLRRLGDPQSPSSLSDSDVNFVVYHTPIMDTLCGTMVFGLGQEGWYQASITMDSVDIGSSPSSSTTSSSSGGGSELTLIVLSRHERSKVNRYFEGGYEDLPSFEADLVSEGGGSLLSKPKTVWCSMTTKQITVRDYILRIFPRKLFNFRLAPSTKIVLTKYSGPDCSTPVICFKDGFQGNPELMMKDGNIFAACFYLMLLHKMGGSESFRDKQTFFNAKLLKHHQSKGHKHTRLALRVDRADIIGSSYRATKWFSEADWCRLFEVEFEGELGIDHGGVRREWFEVLCKKLFHPSSGLFVSVEENSEAVFPNPNPGPDAKSKLYRFAGRVVGKCLYESAHGTTYRQQLPARLAKSFLAQLVGLRVHYKHFADDAPELYSSKISFIEENPVSDLDLTFTDEEYGPSGELLRTADLVSGGARVPVTERNKSEYLDALAQRRLCARVREQTEAFLQGLHQVVPDSLLSLFDEGELELMLCGVREYSLGELRQHHDALVGLPARTEEWFWAALASFTPEQFARLLQFATGSSQLPPGGFAELRPRFQVGPGEAAPGSLPTAHTCFNMICLPEHPTFEDFQRALHTAISEGAEGFGLA